MFIWTATECLVTKMCASILAIASSVKLTRGKHSYVCSYSIHTTSESIYRTAIVKKSPDGESSIERIKSPPPTITETIAGAATDTKGNHARSVMQEFPLNRTSGIARRGYWTKLWDFLLNQLLLAALEESLT